jgi:hypothetical protein
MESINLIYPNSPLPAEVKTHQEQSTPLQNMENPDYLAKCIAWLAERCWSPYKTRVLKALFIADQLSFEERGYAITALSYVHMPHGPMVANPNLILQVVRDAGYIQIYEDNSGVMILATDKDWEIQDRDYDYMEQAARFVNSFASVKELSNSTHTLTHWKNSRSGQEIGFQAGKEVTELVNARLEGLY